MSDQSTNCAIAALKFQTVTCNSTNAFLPFSSVHNHVHTYLVKNHRFVMYVKGRDRERQKVSLHKRENYIYCKRWEKIPRQVVSVLEGRRNRQSEFYKADQIERDSECELENERQRECELENERERERERERGRKWSKLGAADI